MFGQKVLSVLLLLLCASSAVASPQYRGFQISPGVSDRELDQLQSEYGANIVRIQIGNDRQMDYVFGKSYVRMMDQVFDSIDPLLDKLADRNIKVVFALYSPPGGFETRTYPTHYRMFSHPELQREFINMWRRIIRRYKDHPAIYAFDLLNEPALVRSFKRPDVRDWSQLLLDTINAIRKISPDSLIMVKSLYGDPTKLTALPPIKAKGIIYSYHAYLYLAYQHAGVHGYPTDTPAPSQDKISKKLAPLLMKFYLKHYNYYLARRVPSPFPVLNAGEVAVSAAAKNADQFLEGMLNVLEENGGTRNRSMYLKRISRKHRQRRRLLATDFRNLIQHDSWTVHAFDEAHIWDARYQCESQSQCVFVGDSERNQVIQEFMSRN